eukprot:CAMPEP_0116824686 /NCGR_PEP_ID=MMETSP0418-20121206/1534_1 /TAXON_ID=1158023 /ORGANISM="Astrosyne radiata, Strain 13vi08-1A" /LENGTH=585 /DNA_ID=CAMNT_0004453083 /DNA_START=301 /DNA_END=2059 /DNA_ORIENTATION=+
MDQDNTNFDVDSFIVQQILSDEPLSEEIKQSLDEIDTVNFDFCDIDGEDPIDEDPNMEMGQPAASPTKETLHKKPASNKTVFSSTEGCGDTNGTNTVEEMKKTSTQDEPPLATAESTVNMDKYSIWKDDDVERWVCHEDFDAALILGMKVKDITCAIARGSKASISALKDNQDEKAARRFIQKIKRCMNLRENLPVNPRGTFPFIDKLMDQFLATLQFRMDQLEERHEELKEWNCPSKRKSKTEQKGIATKYDKITTDYLNEWMCDNIQHPYPSQNEIASISLGCSLSPSQVNNWATNVRKRNLKGTKKTPHGFLDFKFKAMRHDKRKHIESATPCGESNESKAPAIPMESVRKSQGPYSDALRGVSNPFMDNTIALASSFHNPMPTSQGYWNHPYPHQQPAAENPPRKRARVEASSTSSQAACAMSHSCATTESDIMPLSLEAPIDDSMMHMFAQQVYGHGQLPMDDDMTDSEVAPNLETEGNKVGVAGWGTVAHQAEPSVAEDIKKVEPASSLGTASTNDGDGVVESLDGADQDQKSDSGLLSPANFSDSFQDNDTLLQESTTALLDNDVSDMIWLDDDDMEF